MQKSVSYSTPYNGNVIVLLDFDEDLKIFGHGIEENSFLVIDFREKRIKNLFRSVDAILCGRTNT